jgi:AraC-like DNA-binding protein
MAFAALLPKHSAEHVRSILPRTPITFANTWDELSKLLRSHAYDGALIDPETAGDNTAAAKIINEYPRVHIFAYVEPTASSLRKTFRLSKQGLEDVFVHPVRSTDQRFLNAIEKVRGDNLASDVLAAVEEKLRGLPLSVLIAVRDLFRRPYRYQNAKDLANEAGISLRGVHRALQKAEFCTPRTLITMAKVIHGCCYVHRSQTAIQEVSNKLGYRKSELFSTHVRKHLGMRPSNLRRRLNSGELLLSLIEGLYKPAALRRHARKSRATERK